MLYGIAIAVVFFGSAWVGKKAVHGVVVGERAVVRVIKKPFHRKKPAAQPWKREAR